MKKTKAPRWIVTYLLDEKRPMIRRYFPSEKKARAFYSKIVRRWRNPAIEASIFEEGKGAR